MIQNHLTSFQTGAPDAGSSILYSAISDLDIGEVAIPAFTVPGAVDQDTVNALLQLPTEAAVPSSDPWAIGASEGAAAIYPAAIPAGLNGQSASQLSVEAAIRLRKALAGKRFHWCPDGVVSRGLLTFNADGTTGPVGREQGLPLWFVVGANEVSLREKVAPSSCRVRSSAARPSVAKRKGCETLLMA